MIKFSILLIIFQTILFAALNGNIIDINTLKPIDGAMISDSKITVKSDKNGNFSIDTDEKNLHIKSYGYRALAIKNDTNLINFKLEPITIKALYLSFWKANLDSNSLKKIIQIIEKKEVNAVVVDIKSEYGLTSYKTSFKQANNYGASRKTTIKNIKSFIDLMKSKNIYTIARVVTFKDELQALNNPSYAIKKNNGKIWRSRDKVAWVDPFDIRSHLYTIAIAEDAAKVGFDEINFDYIRFPAKSNLIFAKKNTQANRIEAISKFLSSAKNRLRKYGVYISVDIYGNILWTNDDSNIGQTIKSLSKNVDYIAPMLYPSGFAKGFFGKKNPSNHPFIVIYKSLKNIKNIIEPIRVRPWLQYFRDYAHAKKRYKKFEINEQIRAAEKMKSNGWMMWSSSSRYHLNYFKI